MLIVGNLYAHNRERNPLFKGGVRGAMVNNLIYDPGPRAMHYNLCRRGVGRARLQTGELAVVGNVLRAGPSTAKKNLSLFMFGAPGQPAPGIAGQPGP